MVAVNSAGINAGALRVLIVARVSSPGHGKQDPRSVDDQEALVREWISRNIDEPCEIEVLAGYGSGENLDRKEFLELTDRVAARRYDLIVTEDLGRIVRRLRAHMFAEECVDNDVRLVAINDHIDTAERGWQDRSIFSSWHHERSNRDTSDRIKRAHRSRFQSGGCAAIPIYGYIKPPGSKSDSDWQKDPEAEPIYQEWFERLDRRESFAEVSDWLNGLGMPTGPYCRSERWTGTFVGQVTRNPLLKGLRFRNRRVSKRDSRGKYRSLPAEPNQLLTREVLHLAFIEPAEYDRILAKIDARNTCYRRGNAGRDDRRGVPRKRTRFPGQITYCGVCGRAYVFGGNGVKERMMCSGVKEHRCWNGATFDASLAARRISACVMDDFLALPEFINTYSYDAAGRMTQVTQAGQPGGRTVAEKRVDLAYDNLGRIDTIARYEDLLGTEHVATSDYGFDLAGRLISLAHAAGAMSLASYNYTYDRLGRLAQETSVDWTKNYDYDEIGQLTGVTGAASENYAYDATGNRTGGTVIGTNNRLLDDGTHTYLYSDNGNRIRRTNKATGDYEEYAWDHRNRLVAVKFHNAAGTLTRIIEYRYDAFDRLIARLDNTDGLGAFEEEEYYVHDSASGKGGLDDIVLTYDENGAVAHRYLHGPAVDQIFSDESTVDGLLWALADRQGSVRDWGDYDEATDTTSVYNHVEYDSFGNIENQSNAVHEITVGYTGRYFDPVTGLQWNRGRWYDASTGRWLSEDPIGFGGGDVNLGRYVRNGSTNFTDPSGLDWLDSYANAFNSVFGSGYSETVGGALQAPLTTVYGGTEGLANASANSLAAVTAGAATVTVVGGYYALPAAGSALTATPSLTLPSTFAIAGGGELAVVGGGTIALPSALELAGAAGIAYAVSPNGPLDSLMSKGFEERDIDICKLRYPAGRQYAEPHKLKAHGRFDWGKYEPIEVRFDGVRYWLQAGVTRCDNAFRSGILKLPAKIFSR